MQSKRRMYGPTRAVMTLVGAGAAGLLIWLATQVGTGSTGDFWSFVALLAAAGLVIPISQLLGGWTKWGWPRVSPAVFLVGFLPAFLVGGWIVVAAQPDPNDARTRVLDWSGDVGLGGLVGDFIDLFPVLAFALGVLFGVTFDTTGPRGKADTYEELVAEEPVSAEREELAVREEFHEPDREVARALAHDGGSRVEIRESDTDVIPRSEPERRRTDERL